MNAIKRLRDKYYSLNRPIRLIILTISIFIPIINMFSMVYIVYKILVKIIPKYRSLNSKLRLSILFGVFIALFAIGIANPPTEVDTPKPEPVEIEQNINDNTATEEVKVEVKEDTPEVVEIPEETSTTPPLTVEPQLQVQSKPASIQNNDLYTVASVVDGDTAKLIINGKTETLRIIGLDTPETVDPRKPVQCFGKEATAKAKDLLLNKKVKIESDLSQGERDKYGRLLLYIILPDGRNFSKVMIEDGYAFEYTYGTPYKYQREFKEAQTLAKSQNRGLWNSSTCNGQSKFTTTLVTPVPVVTKPTQTSTPKPAPTPVSITQPNNSEVKKSDSGICHDTSSRYYERTIKYTAYKTIQECLDSGGRLPAK